MRLIFCTVLIQKSDKKWEVLSGCLKTLPRRIPSGLKPEGKYFQTVQCYTVKFRAVQMSAVHSVQCYTVVQLSRVELSSIYRVTCHR